MPLFSQEEKIKILDTIKNNYLNEQRKYSTALKEYIVNDLHLILKELDIDVRN